MLARRLLFALAILMAITALAAGLAPRQTPLGESDRETATPSGEPAPDPVEATLDARSEGQTVQARVGQIVRIVVNSSELESVSLAEVGTKTAEPDSPARFELLAEVPGSYAIDLLESERRIGTLEIEG